MKLKTKRNFCIAAVCLLAFMLWTLAIRLLDVAPIGPQGSSVGFAAFNGAFHDLTGVHMRLYTLTDWLSLIPVGFVFGFALLGLVQWIRRKHILKVDYSILVLGGFYILVLAAYLLFEELAVNYRPVLISGILEASYPSSTTMLVLCVMTTASMQLSERIQNSTFRKAVCHGIHAFTAFMVVGRLISGVHWITDIIGGALLSAGLVMLYHAVVGVKRKS
ncbi:MAG: phosphatase PAP2 family protein [Oscillospiraceae bacterium]|nr:phosphatase PAP2 family protein [Oscillospiraceae bacterium]